MQKLDFTKNLEVLVERLQSATIVQQFNTGFAQPNKGYNYGLITPVLFTSKSNFDQIKTDPRYQEILDSLNAAEIFSEQNLSKLTSVLKGVAADAIIVHPNAIALFNFHNTLLATYTLAKRILTSETLQSSLDDNINNGVVVFQILIEGEGLETEKYIKIFSTLQELIRTISKITSGQTEHSEVVLLDSGSDTNLGIKTGIETAKSLFLIFKEIWDYITNFRHYKMKQKNQTLLDSLTVRAEIKKRVDEGVLTEDEGKEYMHIIKTRTDELIGMKVLPKQLVLENNVIENKKLLTEFEGLKMISGGDSA
jgi:hypothetical protein